MAGVIERNNVHVRGAGERTMVFAHGFSCEQNMWRFAREFRARLAAFARSPAGSGLS